MKWILMAALLVVAALAGCIEEDNGDRAGGGSEANSAVICTNFGPITIQLYTERAPITTQNFIDLAESGYYDGVVFHRIITNFMMQGGDPTGTGRGGEAAGGGTIDDEFHPELRHDKAGILSMANAGPNTGSSQFFITFAATPWLDDKHAVFAEVTGGMGVVEAVEAEAASQDGTPRTDVYMQTVLVGEPASSCPGADGVPEPVPAFACPVEDVDIPSEGLVAQSITPGLLCITNSEDQHLVYARNFAQGAHELSWSLTGVDGSALPEGWTASFADEGGSVGGHGSDDEAIHTMLTISVPEGTDGEFELELHTGESVTTLTAHVDLVHDELSTAGDNANVQYAGRCASDGKQFDAGEFPLTLGQGRAITGFDLGLIGMGENEAATIHIPAPLAYGYDGPVCAGDNADLIFEVTLLSI